MSQAGHLTGNRADAAPVLRCLRQVLRPARLSLADTAAAMVLLAASVPLAVLVAVRAGGGAGVLILLAISSAQIITSVLVVMRRRVPLMVAGCVMLTAAGVVSGKLILTQFPVPGRGGEHSYHFLDPWLPVAIGVAVHAVCRYGGRWQARIMWLAVGLVTLTVTQPWQPSAWPGIPAGLLFTAVPALAGLYVATREDLVRALTDRAERAEREQELRTEQARAGERARLAAELHDVVTHQVSLMVLRAGAWRVQAADPVGRQAAEALRSAGCQVLDELRDLLAVLRSEPGSVRSARASVSGDVPLPDLMPLVEAARLAGSVVGFRCDGPAVAVSPVVSRAIYRIVQEALTNVRKHAAGTDVDVHLRQTPDSMLVCVRNSAPAVGGGPADCGLAGTGAGTGLLGLRERVTMAGGQLIAEPADAGGFEVRARLPLRLPRTGSREA